MRVRIFHLSQKFFMNRKTHSPSPPNVREQRLQHALKANVARRKQQAHTPKPLPPVDVQREKGNDT
jgi:hypothetical protein